MSDITTRLKKWMLRFEQPAPLDLDHPAQVDIAEAADRITELEQQLAKQNCNYEHSVAFCNKCGWMPPQAVRDQTAKLTEQDKLLDECSRLVVWLSWEDLTDEQRKRVRTVHAKLQEREK